MKTTLLTVNPPRRLARSLPYLSALIFLVGFNLRADVPPTILHLAQSAADTEGLATYRLDWNAVSNATYRVQSATDLAGADAWQTIDVVTPTNSAGMLEIKGRSIPENSVEYFRLILPQPQIFSVKPAVFAPGVPVDAYVIGQCFETNDVVRVDGVAMGSVIYLSNNMLQGPLPTLSVGSHLVELVRGGVVKSSFTVVCADPLANPELVLQGPPTMEPPASPSAPARSKQSEAKSNTKAMFTAQRSSGGNPDLDDEGNSGPIAQAGTRVRKGMQDIKNLAPDFEIQEGKKGLNAVNVKLARMAGGGSGGGGKMLDLFHCWPSAYHPPASTACEVGRRGLWGLGGNLDFDTRTAVVPFSGEVQQEIVDLAIEGRGLDFVWARTYRSRPGVGLQITIKIRREYSYKVAAAQTTDGIAVADGTGRVDTYKLQPNGTYTCPEFFRAGSLSNNTFTLTFADTGRWVFQPFDGSSAAGKLRQIITRNGDTMTLDYDPSGQLTEVVDDLGRTNTVGYDSDGRLASVTDFSGRTVTYQYYQGLPGEKGGAGDLKSVTSPPVTGTPNGNDFPAGKTTTYTYSTGYLDDRENHLLLSVIDAKGETTQQYVYQHNQTDFDFLRCISVQRGTNTPTMLTYLPQPATPTNQFATLRCIVNDPVGNVTECFFDARGRCVKSQEFTGRATPGSPVTATVNRPAGKLRTSDPDYYETLAEWNNDSLLTKVKREYSGDKTFSDWRNKTFSYASDFDPTTPARKRADCRVVREIASSPVDLDGDGTADATERVWRYEYDPRFGSSAKTDRRSATIKFLTDNHTARGQYYESDFGFSFTREKLKGTTGNPHGDAHLERHFDFEIEGLLTGGIRAISSTDPRGNVTTTTYDAKGNATSKFTITRYYAHTPEFVNWKQSYAYDPYGQLTAITNAPDATGFARVDMFDYYTNGPQQGYLKSCVVDAGGLALTESYEYDARGNLTRSIDPQTNDWLYVYNSLDQCVSRQTPQASFGERVKTVLHYDANDNVVRCDVENRAETGALDAANPQWTTLFEHDALDRLTGIVQEISEGGGLPGRYATNRFGYDGNDNLTEARSPLAVSGADPLNTVAFEYDERGLLFREIGAPGSPDQSTTQCDYDANGNVTRVSEGLEGTPSITTLEYDGFAGYVRVGGKAQGVMGAKAKAWMVNSFEVHPVFGMKGLAWVETVWNKQCVEKDTTVRLAKITDPMGNVTTFHYDANDNLKVVRHFGELNDVPGTNGNIRLAESRCEYDGFDRPVALHHLLFTPAKEGLTGDFAKGEAITRFAYAPNGQCTSITDDLGRATTLAYDTVGRHVSTTSAGAKTVTAVFRDAAGNVTRTTQTDQPDLGGPPQVFSHTNVFDSLNRCVRTTDNVGNTAAFAYDSRDNCVRSTDPNGNVTVYAYDGLSRPVSSSRYQGATTTIVSSSQSDYDDNDRCTSSTDANGNVTLHAYDSQDRLTQTTQADGTHHTLVWSPRSNLIQETDANGTVLVHTYDLNDRCLTSNITPGSGVALTTTFETFAYDGCSQLVAASNDVSGCTFMYGSEGSRVQQTRNGLTTTSTYDSLGNRLSLTYPGGRALAYAYDALDQCTNIMENGTSLASFSFAGPGRMARVAYGNGLRTQVSYDGLAGTPNALDDFGHGQISSVTHAVTGGSPKIAGVSLKWDRNGNKTLRTDIIFAPAIPRTNHLGLEYDAADRLTRASVISGSALLRDTIYGLDRMGNRTNVTGAVSCSGNYTMDSTVSPGDAQRNRYTATPCDTRTYDANGNLVSRSSPTTGPVTYQYDYADRLVLVQSVDLSSGSVVLITSTYAYDVLGQRISKSVSTGGLPPVTTQYSYDVVAHKDNDDRVQYVYGAEFENAVTPYKDGEANEMRSRPGSVIEERENGLVTASFVLDGTRSQDDGVIQMRRAGQDYYFHTDDQGNVLALTGANGAVAERYDYDDYGAVTFLTSDGLPTSATASVVGNPYCWNGLRLDAETGLHNNDGGGYHEPQSGRVITVPWIANQPSIPHRISAGNNPWSGGEPVGMQKGTVKFFNEAKGFGRVGGGGPFSTMTGSFKKMKDSVIQNTR